jgi:Helix-turn-helix of DDE superfamily endonuclease
MKGDPFLERIGLPHSIQEKRTADMYHATGFSKDEIVDLCAMVRAADLEPGINNWPPILGLFKSVVVTLTYLRRNHVQEELAEYFGVSQSTISRAITELTPIVARMLADHVPVAEDLDRGERFIIDGTLLPCWSWAACPELYSGKHKTTVVNMNAGGGQAG